MKFDGKGFRGRCGEVWRRCKLARAFWLAVALSQGLASGQVFTYQGRLVDHGSPANGSYDFQFGLTDAATNGNYVGGSITKAAVAVNNGLFAVPLDFGAGAFTGPARWLEISVRTNGSAGSYVVLLPRQALTAAPFAAFAAVASNLVAGSTVTGNGAGLTNVAITSLVSGVTDPLNVGGPITSSNGTVQGVQLKAGAGGVLSAAGYFGNGGMLTNLSGANLQPGSVTTNQLDPAFRDGFIARNSGGGTNTTFFSARGQITMQVTDYPTFNDGIWYTNASLRFNNMLTNVMSWDFTAEDGTQPFQVQWNTRHSLGPEIGIVSVGAIALAPGILDGPFNPKPNRRIQIGAGVMHHGLMTMNYDNPGNVGYGSAGYSLPLVWVAPWTNWNGGGWAAHQPGIFGKALDTSGNTALAFYRDIDGSIAADGNVNFANYGLMGYMDWFGWNFRGRIATEHTVAQTSTNAYLLDWKNPSSLEIQVASTNSLSFTTTNLPAGFTNNETRTVLIKSGTNAPRLTFPSGWHWVSQTGTLTAPTNLPTQRVLILTLTALGPGDTNVFATYQSGAFVR
jgi:hypothetical protein